MLLALETSDRLTGIAFYENGQTVIEYSYNIPMQHASILGRAVERGLAEMNRFRKTQTSVIKNLAVAIGPGSFTGLRIGLSFAQGYCFGRQIPVAAISNHTVLAHQAYNRPETVFTLIDARRREVYLARHILQKDGLYEMDEAQTLKTDALPEVIPNASILVLAPGFNLPQATGRALQKAGCTLRHLPAYRASDLAVIAEKWIRAGKTIPAEQLEPMYIRTFAGVL